MTGAPSVSHARHLRDMAAARLTVAEQWLASITRKPPVPHNPAARVMAEHAVADARRLLDRTEKNLDAARRTAGPPRPRTRRDRVAPHLRENHAR